MPLLRDEPLARNPSSISATFLAQGCHWEMLNSKSNSLCYSQPDPETVSQLEITRGWIMGSEGQGAGGCLSLERSQTTVDVSPKGNIASLLVVS